MNIMMGIDEATGLGKKILTYRGIIMELKQFENYKYIDGGVCAAKGFKANGIFCGLGKNPNKNDLGMIFAEKKCPAAAVYTQNKVKGAPIIVTQKNLRNNFV